MRVFTLFRFAIATLSAGLAVAADRAQPADCETLFTAKCESRSCVQQLIARKILMRPTGPLRTLRSRERQSTQAGLVEAEPGAAESQGAKKNEHHRSEPSSLGIHRRPTYPLGKSHGAQHTRRELVTLFFDQLEKQPLGDFGVDRSRPLDAADLHASILPDDVFQLKLDSPYAHIEVAPHFFSVLAEFVVATRAAGQRLGVTTEDIFDIVGRSSARAARDHRHLTPRLLLQSLDDFVARKRATKTQEASVLARWQNAIAEIRDTQLLPAVMSDLKFGLSWPVESTQYKTAARILMAYGTPVMTKASPGFAELVFRRYAELTGRPLDVELLTRTHDTDGTAIGARHPGLVMVLDQLASQQIQQDLAMLVHNRALWITPNYLKNLDVRGYDADSLKDVAKLVVEFAGKTDRSL